MIICDGGVERGRALLVPPLSSGWLGRDSLSPAPGRELRREDTDVARLTSRSSTVPLAALRADGLGEFGRLRRDLALATY